MNSNSIQAQFKYRFPVYTDNRLNTKKIIEREWKKYCQNTLSVIHTIIEKRLRTKYPEMQNFQISNLDNQSDIPDRHPKQQNWFSVHKSINFSVNEVEYRGFLCLNFDSEEIAYTSTGKFYLQNMNEWKLHGYSTGEYIYLV